MLINTQHKEQWDGKEAVPATVDSTTGASKSSSKEPLLPLSQSTSPLPPTSKSPSLVAASAASSDVKPAPKSQPNASASPAVTPDGNTPTTKPSTTTAAAPLAVKKGFLNTAKTSLYPETVKFKTASPPSSSSSSTAAKDILLPSASPVDETPFPPPLTSNNTPNAGIQVLGDNNNNNNTIRQQQGGKDISDKVSKEKDKPKEDRPLNGADLRAVSSARRSDKPPASAPATAPSSILEPPNQAAKTSNNTNHSNGKTPQYTMKERGHISMGDFQPLREKVASNRSIIFLISLLPSLILSISLCYCVKAK